MRSHRRTNILTTAAHAYLFRVESIFVQFHLQGFTGEIYLRSDPVCYAMSRNR